MSGDIREIRFGTLAVEMEFVTAAQLGRAVSTQMKEDISENKHRLLGEILVDMGFMNASQVESVLKSLKQKRLLN